MEKLGNRNRRYNRSSIKKKKGNKQVGLPKIILVLIVAKNIFKEIKKRKRKRNRNRENEIRAQISWKAGKSRNYMYLSIAVWKWRGRVDSVG